MTLIINVLGAVKNLIQPLGFTPFTLEILNSGSNCHVSKIMMFLQLPIVLIKLPMVGFFMLTKSIKGSLLVGLVPLLVVLSVISVCITSLFYMQHIQTNVLGIIRTSVLDASVHYYFKQQVNHLYLADSCTPEFSSEMVQMAINNTQIAVFKCVVNDEESVSYLLF